MNDVTTGEGRADSREARGAGRRHTLRVLSPAECFDLLESAVVGRVGFTSADGVMMRGTP